MATFAGSSADDTYPGTSDDDTITSGGGKDTLGGAGGNDTFILNAQLANGSSIDGGAGTDTIALKNFADAPVRRSYLYPEGIAATGHAFHQNASFTSIERIRFDSEEGSVISAGFGFGTRAGYISQFANGQISPTAELIGGAGYDMVSLAAYVDAGVTVDAPVFAYTNWQTPARAYLPGDRVTISMPNPMGGGTLNGSAHSGVQNLVGARGDDTINGSDNMDFILGGGGVDHLHGNGGDDTLAFVQTIHSASNGETLSGWGGFSAQGIVDGGDGFDFLMFAGPGVVRAEIRNIEGIYLSPDYDNERFPDEIRTWQLETAVMFDSKMLKELPSDLLLAGTGTMIVNLAYSDQSGYVLTDQDFDASGYVFEAGSNVRFQIKGSSLADEIVGSSGNDRIDGGSGRDIVVFTGDHADYIVSRGDDATLTFVGPDGEDTLSRVEIFRFDDGDYIWKAGQGLVVAPGPETGASFKLFLGQGFAGEVGGSGTVTGTNGFEDISIIGDVDTVTFDASFNRGGDVIRLPGFANDYWVRSEGSRAIFTNDLATYSIPVGEAGAYIVFDDDAGNAARVLRYAGGQTMVLGNEGITSLEAVVSAPSGAETFPVGADPAGVSRMFLGTDGVVRLGGNYQVQGTNGVERVTWLHGDLMLDGSFNRGGDGLTMRADAEDISAYIAGSRVILLWGDDSASIPFGPSGMTLDLIDGDQIGSREIRYDVTSSTVFIGEQAITALTEASATTLIA